MRRIRASGNGSLVETELTPFADVIFQLVLFFVFSLKFLGFEGALNARLPRDRGPGEPSIITSIYRVDLFLDWDDGGGGRVLLSTRDYRPSGGGSVVPAYTFPMDAGVREVRDPAGRIRAVTEAELRRPDGTASGKVHYDFAAPDFASVEAYLCSRRQQIKAAGAEGDIRLRVDYDGRVPWQAVVGILDICERQKIEDFDVAPVVPKQ